MGCPPPSHRRAQRDINLLSVPSRPLFSSRLLEPHKKTTASTLLGIFKKNSKTLIPRTTKENKMADDQVVDVPDTAPAPDAPAQATEMVACQCRGTYHWRHGGGGCLNPAQWCQWCKDGGCVLARQANAARERNRNRSSDGHGRRQRRGRSRYGGLEVPGLPLPPLLPFPMFPTPITFPRPPFPVPMSGLMVESSSFETSSSGSSSGGSSGDEADMALELFRPPRR